MCVSLSALMRVYEITAPPAGVAVAVAVGVGVAVGLGVAVGVGEGVAVALGVGLGFGVGAVDWLLTLKLIVNAVPAVPEPFEPEKGVPFRVYDPIAGVHAL